MEKSPKENNSKELLGIVKWIDVFVRAKKIGEAQIWTFLVFTDQHFAFCFESCYYSLNNLLVVTPLSL